MQIFPGLILIGMGILDRNGNLSALHWHNRRKVSEEDRPSYGKWTGSSTRPVESHSGIVQEVQR